MDDLATYTCYRIAGVEANGWPDQDTWETVPSTGPFVSVVDYSETKLRTDARIAWTEDGLYFRWVCQDTDIWTTFTRRDQHLWEEEVVEVFFSTSEDPWRYFELEVSPNNLIVDLDISWPESGGQRRMSGDIGWNSPGSRSNVDVEGTLDDRSDTDRAWVSQLFVPFADLGVEPPLSDTAQTLWRLNLYRIDRPQSQPIEFSGWSPTLENPASYHVPERFGYMRFSADAPQAGERSSVRHE